MASKDSKEVSEKKQVVKVTAKSKKEKKVTVSTITKDSEPTNTSTSTSTSKSNETLIDDNNLDYRELVTKYDFTKNKSRPCLTKYELALVIGKRSKQIEDGAIPNIEVKPGQSAVEIAEEELKQRKTPFIIKRPIGTGFEYWRPRDMEINFD